MPQDNRPLKFKQSIEEIDILVCAKNRASLLERLLKYLASELPYKSLIVIYASSVDETKKIALKYADKAFWDGDKGLGAARNMAIRMASSKIVAMIDTDVILPKDWAQKIISHFKDQEVAAAMGRCIYGYGCAPLQKLWEHYSLSDEAWGCQNVMFNREIVLGVGNFNDKIRGAGEDYELFRRLVDAGFKVVVDKEVLAYHPMNLIEYAKHSVWWTKGRSSVENKPPQGPMTLCRTLLQRVMYNFSLRHIHPLLVFYLTIVDTWRFLVEFKVRRQQLAKES